MLGRYVGYQLACALEYVGTWHRMIHMDVAARNCLISAKTHIKLADFGVAQIMDDGKDTWKQVRSMMVL